MDGGVRSVANADLAAGCERVVIVVPVATGIGHMPSPSRQAAALAAAGAHVVLVRPDRAAVHAIGRNVLDVSRRAAAATAGRARPERQRLRSGQSGGPMAGRSPPSRQADGSVRASLAGSLGDLAFDLPGRAVRQRRLIRAALFRLFRSAVGQVGPGRCGFPRADVGG